MRISRFAKLTLLVSVVTVGSVAAVHAGPITAGTVEFSPSLAFNRSSYTPAGGGAAGSVTHLNLTASLGRALNDRFEVMGGVIVQHRDLASVGYTGEGAAVGGQYNFPAQGNVIPFVSANVGIVRFSSNGVTDRSVLAPMLRVGFRSMIGEARSLNVSFGFQHEENPKSSLEDSGNMFDVGVGMSMFRSHS